MALPDKSFAELVQRMADEHHDGVMMDLARHVGVSVSLAWFWKSSSVKNPKSDTIRKFASAYGLDYWEVHDLVSGRPGIGPTPSVASPPRPLRIAQRRVRRVAPATKRSRNNRLEGDLCQKFPQSPTTTDRLYSASGRPYAPAA